MALCAEVVDPLEEVVEDVRRSRRGSQEVGAGVQCSNLGCPDGLLEERRSGVLSAYRVP